MNARTLPVRDRWFRAQSAGRGVTLLTEPFVDPFLQSNVWHVRGRDRDLVIDTANGIGPLLAEIARLAGARPVIAVVTHGHFDHTGGLHEFPDRRCHARDADAVRHPLPVRVHRRHYPPGLEEEFAYYGYSVPERIVSAVPSLEFGLDEWVTPGAEPTQLVADGETIDLGDRMIDVLHTPGHTSGSVSLWEAATGMLFTGDAAYVDDRMSWEDRDAFVRSLERLAALPVAIVHGGHGPSFDGDVLRGLLAEGALGS